MPQDFRRKYSSATHSGIMIFPNVSFSKDATANTVGTQIVIADIATASTEQRLNSVLNLPPLQATYFIGRQNYSLHSRFQYRIRAAELLSITSLHPALS